MKKKEKEKLFDKAYIEPTNLQIMSWERWGSFRFLILFIVRKNINI